MSIRKDMRDGDEAEQRFIAILKEAGIPAAKNSDIETRQFWDIEGEGFTVEVKNDRYAIKSGNIAIEIFNPKSNKTSGLTVTKADLWAVQVGPEFWIIRTAKLRKFVDTAKPHRIIDVGGDANATLLLYKKEHIFEHFVQIGDMSGEEIARLIDEI